MTAEACYAVIGGNYSEALGRLLKDDRIVKYLKKFAESTDYAEMIEAINSKNWEEAFRFSHNLKGVSLNLALTPLAKSSSELCETMRAGEPTVDISALISDVTEKYENVLSAIAELD